MPTFDFKCRKVNDQDNIGEIARCIHLTDPYIYPVICSDPENEDWVAFIEQCMETPGNIFYRDHLCVLEQDAHIVGIACIVPCGKPLTITENVHVPERLRAGMVKAIQGYFLPLIEESVAYEGYNIVNVCVDSPYRGMGLGTKLVEYCVRKYGEDLIHLDVIASNKTAVKLYQNQGFSIVDEYLGFSGNDTDLPCYHMIRNVSAS